MANLPDANLLDEPPKLPWLVAFWQVLRRVDRGKQNGARLALRNSLAVAVPLAFGIAIGEPLGAVAVATGALNVSYSDGGDPYVQRARRMLAWSALGAVAVFLGSITGNYHLLAILVASSWAFVAGLLVSLGTRPGDLGLNTLVTLIVYAARGALSPKGALYAGLLVLGGGLLQTLFSLLSWPLEQYGPQRRAVGSVYLDLAGQVSGDLLAAPLKVPTAEVQDALSALGRDHSLEGERLRLLFDQADRLRFSIYLVRHNETDLTHESRQNLAQCAREMLDVARQLLESVGESLDADRLSVRNTDLLEQLERLLQNAQQWGKESSSVSTQRFAGAADVLAGQLRVMAQIAENTTTEGAEHFAQRELLPPLKLQMRSWLATLRANLHLQSPAFRHGVRLAVCVAIGDAIGRTINTQRNYWLAMTVAVVLKPDFTTTISRGVLRLCGTFAGLLLATALYLVLPASAITQLFLVGVFTFLMRSVGPANYGIFSLAISGLIVFLIAETGVPPGEVIFERGINTAAGGLFALLAYALWPTWERSQVADVMADMIDSSRNYFHAVVLRFSRMDDEINAALDETRNAWRQARSNAEASVDRLSSEPRVDTARLGALTSMLASSRALVRTMMAMEVNVSQTPGRTQTAAFQNFCHDVEFTLYYLAAALRGSSINEQTFPPLREDYRRLVESSDKTSRPNERLRAEADQLTVSLNTFREQVMKYISASHHAVPEALHTTMK